MDAIADLCIACNATVVASWLPREFNAFCDDLSKCPTLDAARSICSGLALVDLSGLVGPGRC